MYDLPPPNENVYDLRSLVFGRRDYSEEMGDTGVFREPYFYNNNDGRGWLKNKQWRDHLSPVDPMAMVPICKGGPNLQQPNDVWIGQDIFDPDLLERMMLRHPTIIRLVTDIVEDNYNPRKMRPLSSELMKFWRMAYWPALVLHSKVLHEERCASMDYVHQCYGIAPWSTEHPWSGDTHYPKELAARNFDKACELVCKFLVRHHDLYPDEWVPLMAEHSDLSAYAKLFVMPGATARKAIPQSRFKNRVTH